MSATAEHPTLEQKPRIARGFRLQWEEAQQAFVLLYPEGMVQLNASAGQILSRCDGQRSVGEVVSELERDFETEGLADDVIAFLDLAEQQRWVEWK